MANYTVRFHLAKGVNFMKWQVKHIATGQVSYYCPSKVELRLFNCKLRNQSGTAKKINEGANKTVCAWIDCDSILIKSCSDDPYFKFTEEYKYDPKRFPYWVDSNKVNRDNTEHKELYTLGRCIYKFEKGE